MEIKDKFLKDGCAHLESLITINEVEKLSVLYNDLLSDSKNTKGLRSDLSGANDGTVKDYSNYETKPCRA